MLHQGISGVRLARSSAHAIGWYLDNAQAIFQNVQTYVGEVFEYTNWNQGAIVNAVGKRLSRGGPKLHTFLVSVPAYGLWLARQPCGLGGVFDVRP